MARPEEKSQSMLHRYLRSRAGEDGTAPRSRGQRRPYLATLCEDVDEAEKWRRHVLRDIERKVSDIQNPGLGDERTRELNDEINKLFREKRHWERRIKQLGGQNYLKTAMVPASGPDGPAEHKGYFYFGAARELPGVAALLAGDVRAAHGTDGGDGEWDDTPIEELLQRIDPSRYYGYQDKELEKVEQEREYSDRKALIEQWESEERPTVDEGVEWDSSEWEEYVGKAPVQGPELQKALAKLDLEEQKLSALEAVNRMEAT